MWQTVSIVLMLTTFVGLSIYDVYVVFFNKEKGDDLSGIIRRASRRAVTIPFAMGALMGHWFWPGTQYMPLLLGLAALTCIATSFGLLSAFVLYKLRLPDAMLILWVLLGIVAGHFLWPL